MYDRSVLSGRKCCNFVVKETFDLCCTARARKRGQDQSKTGKKLTPYLDFTNVCWRKNITAFSVRFYLRLRSVLAGRSECPSANEFGTVLFFSEKQDDIRFNSTVAEP